MVRLSRLRVMYIDLHLVGKTFFGIGLVNKDAVGTD